MFDLFSIFFAVSENRESGGGGGGGAADKVNIMECDPESTSVTIRFFSKISVHYYALTMEL